MADDDATRLRQALNNLMYEEMELRVGMSLSEGMTDLQLEEFEALIDRDRDLLSAWLRRNSPDFEHDPKFKLMESALPSTIDPLDLVAEYAATKWLELNRPDYREVVEATKAQLTAELKRYTDDPGSIVAAHEVQTSEAG